MGTEIFHLRIVQVGAVNESCFSVHAEDAAAEVQEIIFQPDDKLKGLLATLQERKDLSLGFADFDAQEKGCAKIGAHLFQKFFVPPALQRYKDYRARNNKESPRIALHIPRSLYYLPWEVLREVEGVDGQFLSIEGSIIRYDDESQRDDIPLNARPPKSSFLFLMASPDDDPLGGTFDPVDADLWNFIHVDPANYVNFGKGVKNHDPEALFFFGHGDSDDAGNGYLVFVQESRFIRKRRTRDNKAAYSIGTDLGTAKQMRVAYILACESAWASEKIKFRNSIAGSILDRTRLAFVVGAQTKIDFFATHDFATQTLEALAEHAPLDLAISRGRKAIRDIFPSGVRKESWRDWWVPVLYARTTDFELFPAGTTLPLPGDAVAGVLSTGYGILGAAKNLLKRELFADDKPPMDILGG
jgi:hypothetical protein